MGVQTLGCTPVDESFPPERSLEMRNPQRSRPVTNRIAALCLAITVGALGSTALAAPAFAHDSVISSTPERGSSISELPEDIVLEFSGEPKDGFNTMSVTRDGKVLFSGEPSIEGRELTLAVPEGTQADAGDYRIGYQITSSDGHATRGSVDFTLTGGDAASSDNPTNNPDYATDAGENDASAEGEQGDAQSAVPTWLLPLGGIVVVAGALVVAIMRYRELKKTDRDA